MARYVQDCRSIRDDGAGRFLRPADGFVVRHWLVSPLGVEGSPSLSLSGKLSNTVAPDGECTSMEVG